ncbi:MAG TPA: choice-of-anchor D domain-containing protein [Candidatus Acidoferrum sp.]|nr:choice-of-anchor D domain-containing protein [Candidatus Acidoferrum sp.]
MLLLGMASLGLCQIPQQHVYATGTGTNNPSVAVISGFDKNSASGSLAAIPGSPFPAHNAAPMAVDGQGKFLFVAGPTSIAMYAIDPASGMLTEVPRSPIPYVPIPGSQQPPSNPLSIATEPTGQFVYVGFQNGDYPGNPEGNSSITPFVIDTSNATLGPTLDLGPQWSIDFNETPTSLYVEPSGRHLYVALGPYSENLYAGFDVYDIDGDTGELENLNAVDTPGPSQISAMDPKGRFLFQAYGQYNSWLSSFQLSPADGSVTAITSIFVDYTMVHGIVVDPSGNFLYVNVGGAPASFNTYSIDQTTGALTQLSSSTQIAFPFGQWTVADPQGPYLYTLLNGSVHGFQSDPTAGTVTELSGSPFTDGSANYYESGLCITNTNPQASSGPYLEISGGGPFPQTPVGTISPQTITVILSNIGDVTMSLSSLAIAGDATHSFSETNNCPNTLVPQASCQATLSFTPAVTGVLQATLQITDNAPGSPQSVSISGVGTSSTTQPQVSLSSSNLGFGSQTQGTSSTPQVITLNNTGNAPLHVSAVTLTGSYPKDWTQTNTCAVPLAAQGTCTISVTFSPSDNGILSAVLTVADDAPSSPQTINLYGNAPPAALVSPATSGGSTVATVPAGTTATYNLQVVPGPSFSGTINLTCSGAPFGAVCTVPASVAVGNGAATPFTVSISTLSSSQAAVFPLLPRPPSGPLRPQPGFSLAFFAALLLFALTLRSRMQSQAPRWLASVTAVLLVTALVFSGIGCGSAGSSQIQTQPPPQSAATPAIQPAAGTYYAAQSVTITDATAGATIHYTTDGSTPTASSPTYQAAIPLSSLTTVQALAIAPNYANSAVASATFKFQTPSGTITLTSTATPSGSSTHLALTPIQLTLTVQ